MVRASFAILSAVAAGVLSPGCATPQRHDDAAVSALMEEARTLYDNGRYSKARKVYEELADPMVCDETHAEEATFYVGECYYQQRDYPSARKAYREVLMWHRRSRFFETAISREFVIGANFCTGTVSTFCKRRGWGAKVLVDALELQPFGEHSAQSRLIVADYYFEKGDYEEALHHYEVLSKDFPDTADAVQASYRRGLCLFHSVQCNRYDAKEIRRAINGLEDARLDVAGQPESEANARRLSEIAEKLAMLHDLVARENYDVAQFYRKNKNPKAAAAYYKAVIEAAPESAYAALSRAALEDLSEGSPQ